MVIDGHSHIGFDYYHGESNIDEFVKYALKVGINGALLMLVPSPCYFINGKAHPAFVDNKELISRNISNRNPYLKLNYELRNLIESKTSDSLKLYFVAMFHPLLDDVDDFEQLIIKTKPVALKLHGLGSKICPADISAEFVEIIRKYDLPIIVHTAYARDSKLCSMFDLRNKNHPMLWAKFFVKNHIRGVLNHGAALDINTFNIVNNSNLLKVAIGPDMIMCRDYNQLFVNCENDCGQYLSFIRDNLDASKIIFDVDFNWNLKDDYNPVARICNVFSDSKSRNKVLYQNAQSFFAI